MKKTIPYIPFDNFLNDTNTLLRGMIKIIILKSNPDSYNLLILKGKINP